MSEFPLAVEFPGKAAGRPDESMSSIAANGSWTSASAGDPSSVIPASGASWSIDRLEESN